MDGSEIWWDRKDQDTRDLIGKLGGKETVTIAVSAVLPGRKVKLRALTAGISGAVVFLASPQAVRDGRRVAEVEGVLKVGGAKLLCDEVDNWKQWVSRLLAHPSHYAPLDAPDGLKQIADECPDDIHALHYRHVGHITLGERLKELATAGDVDGACRLIDALLVILRPWQEIADPEGSKALTSDGVYSFGADPFKEFEDTCARLNTELSERDPIPGSYRRVRDLWATNALGSERFLQSIVHGDLHIDNVLIGSDGGLTLIDFGATGPGHFLRDLSTLEAHLVLRGLAPAGTAVAEPHREYLAEVAPLYSSEFFLGPRPPNRPAPLHALVMRLRRYAFYSLMRFNVDYVPQYALAVLRHAVRVCGRADASFSDAQRWIAAHVATALRDSLRIEKRRLVLALGAPLDLLAAYAPLDVPDRGPAPGELHVADTAPCESGTWDALARALRSARRIEFVGIVPIQLISAILSSWDDGASSMPPPRMRYLTRPYGSETRTGRRPAPMWDKAALTGVRNIINSVAKANVSLDGFARAAEGVTTNCLVRSTGYDDRVSLHLAARITEPEALENAYVLARLSDEDGQISDWVERTLAGAEPILIREVECKPLADGSDGTSASFTSPQIVRLSPYGANTSRSGCLRPVALTILRSTGPAGLQVVLKVRSPLVDNDDFGRFSFLSARILADDVAGAASVTMAAAENADDALDALWTSVGRPDQFVLTKDVFVHAARRDVFGTTLLDLLPERFTFKGMHVLERELEDIQLGFAVLTVDLDRNEVAAARHASQLMGGAGGDLLQVIPVSDLFTGELPVNRFMQHRGDWLREHCL
jgi:hypothetical protein